jgi:putative DNA primase/helicase
VTANGAGTQFPFTDAGNGERFIARHGQDVRYVPTWRTWLVWDGVRWRQDDVCELERRAKETARAIHLEADTIEGVDRSATFKHAASSEDARKLRAMLTCAQAEAGIAVRPDAFDAHPMLFNCANGTVNLTSGALCAHARANLLTKRSPVTFDQTAECPRWLKFLDRIFDQDQQVIEYVQRAMGYTITGDTQEQVLHLLHGHGQNGKSTFLEVFADLMGDYGMQADFTSFLDGKAGGPRDDIARLAGARMVRSSEVGEGKRLNESLIKSLTGQDTIAARFLYSKTFEFRPVFKLWFAANHKPVIRGTDLAIWRRIRLIPFLVTIPPDDRDPELADKLRAELPGILNWVIAGALDWHRKGLKAPPIVQIVTDQYRAESDVMGAFLDECCETGNTLEVPASELYRGFKRWCEENGEWCPSQTHFGRRMDDRGFGSRKSNGVKIRKGLKLGELAASRNGHKSWFEEKSNEGE